MNDEIIFLIWKIYLLIICSMKVKEKNVRSKEIYYGVFKLMKKNKESLNKGNVFG